MVANKDTELNEAPICAYDFGPFRLDPVEKTLRRDGKRVKISHKGFLILLKLVKRRGHVVSREEFKTAVWPGTFVEDSNLNFQIAELRKVLDDVGETRRFIETLSGVGYEFVADVQEVPLELEQTKKRKNNPVFAVLGTVAILAFAVGAILFLVKPPAENKGGLPTRPVVQFTVSPLTSFPGVETTPALSPDGYRLAFAWNGGEPSDAGNFDIYVCDLSKEAKLGAKEPQRFTTDLAPDLSPVWSRDGRQLTFIRDSPNRSEGGFFLISVLDGKDDRKERKVGDAFFPRSQIPGRQVEWSPDGEALLVSNKSTPDEPFGLFWLSLQGLEKRQLTQPPLKMIGDSNPVVSKDGRKLAFLRTVQRTGIRDIYVMSLPGSEPKQLTFDQAYIGGLAWAPDGESLVFSSNRTGRFRLWRVSDQGGEPQAVEGAGEYALHLSIAGGANRLTYNEWRIDTNIWRVDLSHHSGRTRSPVQVIFSTYHDTSSQYSPDSQRIAFASERSGNFEIWLSGRNGEPPLQLTRMGLPLGAGTGSPRWSPTGQDIVFDSRASGRSKIYTIRADGTDQQCLTCGGIDFEDVVPSWSQDGRWIYFASNRTGDWQVWKGDLNGREVIQVTRHGGYAAFESLDGTWLYYAKGPSVKGLWRIPSVGGKEAVMVKSLSPGLWSHWAVCENGIIFVDFANSNLTPPAVIKLLNVVDGSVTELATLDSRFGVRYPGISVSRDGRSVVYTQTDQVLSDIMLVEGFK